MDVVVGAGVEEEGESRGVDVRVVMGVWGEGVVGSSDVGGGEGSCMLPCDCSRDSKGGLFGQAMEPAHAESCYRGCYWR